MKDSGCTTTTAGEESLSKAPDLKLLPSHRYIENRTGAATFLCPEAAGRSQKMAETIQTMLQ